MDGGWYGCCDGISIGDLDFGEEMRQEWSCGLNVDDWDEITNFGFGIEMRFRALMNLIAFVDLSLSSIWLCKHEAAVSLHYYASYIALDVYLPYL